MATALRIGVLALFVVCVVVAEVVEKPHPWPGGVVLPYNTKIGVVGGPAKRYVKGQPLDDLIKNMYMPKSYLKLKVKLLAEQLKKKKTLPKMPKTRQGHRVYKGPPLPRGYKAPPNCPTFPFCWQIPEAPAFGPAPVQDAKTGVMPGKGMKGDGGKPVRCA